MNFPTLFTDEQIGFDMGEALIHDFDQEQEIRQQKLDHAAGLIAKGLSGNRQMEFVLELGPPTLPIAIDTQVDLYDERALMTQW